MVVDPGLVFLKEKINDYLLNQKSVIILLEKCLRKNRKRVEEYGQKAKNCSLTLDNYYISPCHRKTIGKAT